MTGIRVVVVNDHLYADGGADIAALGSAASLAEAGAQVTLFVADQLRVDDLAARPYKIFCTGQADLARGQPMTVALQGLWNGEAARVLRTLLAGFDPRNTVVHVHSWTKALSSSVFDAIHRSGFAQVLTLHEYFAVCPNGLLYDVPRAHVCSLEPLSWRCVSTNCDPRRYAHKLYRVARHAVQQNFASPGERVDRFVTISQLSQRVAAKHLPPHARFVQVCNPIDVGERMPPVEPERAARVVMVARLFAPKGWELFLEACRRAQVPALCVGDGPDGQRLRAAYPEATFSGELNRAGVVAAMRGSRALVLASRWYESQGMVIAEAAAHGVPALASDHCGGAEAIEHGVNGFVFASGDVDSLARQLRRIADDDALVRRMGRSAYERFWHNPPTGARHARELLATYRELLAERAAERPPHALAQVSP